MYPELVGVVGGNVPNYQGVFLRGYGGQTSYHYGAVGHWSARLGELQEDEIREIWGKLSYLPRSRDGEMGQSGSLAFWNEGRNQWMNDAGKAPSGAMNFYASRSTPVASDFSIHGGGIYHPSQIVHRRWYAVFPARAQAKFPVIPAVNGGSNGLRRCLLIIVYWHCEKEITLPNTFSHKGFAFFAPRRASISSFHAMITEGFHRKRKRIQPVLRWPDKLLLRRCWPLECRTR